VLLIVGSDHGHETVNGFVDIEAELIAAGMKDGSDSTDVLALSNGTASLIYLHPDQERRYPLLSDYLQSQRWVSTVVPREDLDTIGHAPHQGLAFAVSLRADGTTNEYGIPGCSLAAISRWDKKTRLGCGQHGGFGAYEQSPVLMIEGAGFQGGVTRAEKAHIVDIAPTILRHLGVTPAGMDGRALQT
jgi:hypothetical protein